MALGAAGGSMTIGTTSDGIGATVSAAAPLSGNGWVEAWLSSAQPSIVPAPTVIDGVTQTTTIVPAAYVMLHDNTTLSLAQVPSFTFTFATAPTAPNGLELAIYDPANPTNGWHVVTSSGVAAGSTVTVNPDGGAWTMSSGVQYGIMLFQPTSYSIGGGGGGGTGGGDTGCDSIQRGTRGQRRMIGSGGRGVVPNRFVVTYKSGARAPRSASLSAVTRTVDLRSRDGLTHQALTFRTAADAKRQMASLKTDANVATVSAVHFRRASSDALANDTLLDNVDQWYMYRTNVDAGTNAGAWSLTTGSTSVKLASIDTGVDETNQNLASQIVYKESVLGGVITTGNGSVQDTDGHGTNTAGLAAAQANNNYGFAGVGYNISLMAFNIFPNVTASCSEPSADTADEAQAIDDAVAQGASVISMSLGAPQSDGADPTEQAAVEAAISAGVVVVAAAGNEYGDGTTDGNQVDYPAAYPGVIAVGASAVTDSTANTYSAITADTIASYSNSGATLVAPGGDAAGNDDSDTLHWIEGFDTTTAGIPDDACSNSGTPPVCEVLFNGTSQATPQVAGTVALMEAAHGGSRSLSPATAKATLTATASAIPGISATRQGAGLLNAFAAVSASQ